MSLTWLRIRTVSLTGADGSDRPDHNLMERFLKDEDFCVDCQFSAIKLMLLFWRTPLSSPSRLTASEYGVLELLLCVCVCVCLKATVSFNDLSSSSSNGSRSFVFRLERKRRPGAKEARPRRGHGASPAAGASGSYPLLLRR